MNRKGKAEKGEVKFKNDRPSKKDRPSTKTENQPDVEPPEDVSISESMPYDESIFFEDFSNQTPSPSFAVVLSRTSFLIMDYRRFKAAQKIQAAARGWIARRKYRRLVDAAITIQTEWRRFLAPRVIFRMLEERVQREIELLFYNSAVKIQALWRGYWVRENIHDHYRLARKQMRAAEDLLHCVAFKLHHLLRTHQIPGVYSLKNTHCLSKVEKLLAAMTFKQHNDRVRLARAQRESLIKDAKKRFKKSCFATDLPYQGPDFGGVCDSKCIEFYQEPDVDKKMHKILSIYERASQADPRVKKVVKRERKGTGPAKGKGKKKPATPPDFCQDVVNSMKRWKILAENNITVDPNICRNPENVERFLDDVEKLYENMQASCYCRINKELVAIC